LQKLKKLERLNIAKLRNPLPWKDIIEIGNLFPRLIELQFRSNDVIPPQAIQEQENALEGHHRSKRGRFMDAQPEPLHQEDEIDTEDGPSSVLAVTTTISTAVMPLTTEIEAGVKRKRSCSPSPPPTATTTTLDTDVAGEGSSQQLSENKEGKGKQVKEELPDVMSATLRSGLKISFRVTGEDEDGVQDEPGWNFF
jgi:hypothetical protein